MKGPFVRLSLLCLAMSMSALVVAETPDKQTEQLIANDIRAHVGEFSFWNGIALPSSTMRLAVFEATEPSGNETKKFDVLAIVPELNATYQYRFCGGRVIGVWSEELWITWSNWTWSPGGKKVEAEDYLAQQISRFSDFVTVAKRANLDLTIVSDPHELFSPKFRSQDNPNRPDSASG